MSPTGACLPEEWVDVAGVLLWKHELKVSSIEIIHAGGYTLIHRKLNTNLRAGLVLWAARSLVGILQALRCRVGAAGVLEGTCVAGRVAYLADG